jgi:hypothetical protein
MFVAIEAFLDPEKGLRPDKLAHTELLRGFGEYVDSLDTQPVTVTISSLVEDMMDSYANVTSGLQGFSWRQNLSSLVEEFVYTRDCWFYAPMRAPVVEATFSVKQYGVEQLDIDLAFAWNLPAVGFHNLSNVIAEGEEFNLKPTLPSRAHRAILSVAAEYFVGPGTDGWIRWDGSQECFRGVIPPTLASHVGAERFESYTIPLELTARITKLFPADMRFERIFRCALPLTIKRRPNSCAVDSLTADYDKENSHLSLDDAKLMERKGRGPRAQSHPLRLDSLSLARLHDAIVRAHPPGISTTLPPVSARRQVAAGHPSSGQNQSSTACCSCAIHKCDDHKPEQVSVSENSMPRPLVDSKSKQHRGVDTSRHRDSMLGLEGMHNPLVAAWNLFGMEQAGPADDGPSEEAIDHWQADILRNYKESSDKLEEKLDYTM